MPADVTLSAVLLLLLNVAVPTLPGTLDHVHGTGCSLGLVLVASLDLCVDHLNEVVIFFLFLLRDKLCAKKKCFYLFSSFASEWGRRRVVFGSLHVVHYGRRVTLFLVTARRTLVGSRVRRLAALLVVPGDLGWRCLVSLNVRTLPVVVPRGGLGRSGVGATVRGLLVISRDLW